MKNSNSNMANVLSVLDNNNISYKIDESPSDEKIERIKNAILRKAQLYKDAIEKFNNAIHLTVNN
jgi:hypothetical protein